MKRKISNILNEWKEEKNKKSLLIEGARQVGKTYIVDEFSIQNYPQNKIIKIDLVLNEDMMSFFDGDLNPHSILGRIQRDIRFRDIDFIDDINNPYFIFIDEVQESENALVSLKYFSQESSLFNVVASGSLLGVSLKRKFKKSYPVGFIQHVYMYPLDFVEFCEANGYSKQYLLSLLNTKDINESTHQQMMNLYRDYIVVGGLPEAVKKFIETKSYDKVFEIQKDLVIGYMQDIRKYADSNNQKIKIEKCFNSIPTHLKQQNKKFKYKNVDENGRKRMFEDSLSWLNEAGLIIESHNLKRIDKSLQQFIDEDDFKIYMFDTGILMSMFEPEKRQLVFSGSNDYDIGGIYENSIASILDKTNINEIMYYSLNNELELDFVYEYKGNITILEVKSGNNLKSVSMKKYLNRNSDKSVDIYKVSSKICSDEERIKNITFYQFAIMMCINNVR